MVMETGTEPFTNFDIDSELAKVDIELIANEIEGLEKEIEAVEVTKKRQLREEKLRKTCLETFLLDKREEKEENVNW